MRITESADASALSRGAAAVVSLVTGDPRWLRYAGASWGLLVWVEVVLLRDRVERLEAEARATDPAILSRIFGVR